MKNILDILKEFGLEIPADKQADFNKAVSENYKTVAEYGKKVDRLTEDLNAEKERADTAVNTLKGFEGKDFDAITSDRDEWKRKYEESERTHREEQENREFTQDVETEIAAAKGRDVKAIMANLDLDTLRNSRNRRADIKSALEAQRAERGYLFEDNGGKAYFTQPNGNKGNTGNALTKEDIMNIPDRAERRAAIAQNMHLFGAKKGE